MTPDTDGWSNAEMHVMEELKRLSGEVAGMREEMTNLRVEVAQKGAIWGAVSGIVTAIVATFIKKAA